VDDILAMVAAPQASAPAGGGGLSGLLSELESPHSGENGVEGERSGDCEPPSGVPHRLRDRVHATPRQGVVSQQGCLLPQQREAPHIKAFPSCRPRVSWFAVVLTRGGAARDSRDELLTAVPLAEAITSRWPGRSAQLRLTSGLPYQPTAIRRRDGAPSLVPRTAGSSPDGAPPELPFRDGAHPSKTCPLMVTPAR